MLGLIIVKDFQQSHFLIDLDFLIAHHMMLP